LDTISNSRSCSFTVTRRAHWQALSAVAHRTTAFRLSAAFFLTLPLIIIAITVTRGEDLLQMALSSPLAVFGGPLLVFVGFPLAHYLTVVSYHKRNQLLTQPQIFQITPTHLSMRGPLHNSEVSWEAIVQVLETRHCFLFYVGKNVAYFLPKEAVATQDLTGLRQQLAALLPGRVELKSRSAPIAAA
jgi:hypothetical protein